MTASEGSLPRPSTTGWKRYRRVVLLGAARRSRLGTTGLTSNEKVGAWPLSGITVRRSQPLADDDLAAQIAAGAERGSRSGRKCEPEPPRCVCPQIPHTAARRASLTSAYGPARLSQSRASFQNSARAHARGSRLAERCSNGVSHPGASTAQTGVGSRWPRRRCLLVCTPSLSSVAVTHAVGRFLYDQVPTSGPSNGVTKLKCRRRQRTTRVRPVCSSRAWCRIDRLRLRRPTRRRSSAVRAHP